MGRKLAFALVAACAMIAAAAIVFLASIFLPRFTSTSQLLNNIPFLHHIDKQEQARLAGILQDGYNYQRDGEYDQAIAAFKEVAGANPELADIKEAEFRLGQTYLLNQNYESAASTLQQFYDRYEKDERRDQTAFMLGNAYRQLKQWDKAISFLTDSAGRNPSIEPYIRYQLGLTLRDSGNLPRAIEEFSKAATGTGPRLFEIGAMEQIAEAYVNLKDYNSAIPWYDKLKARAATDNYKAELNYKAGVAYQATGKTAEAKALFASDVTNYPSAGYTVLALDGLNKIDAKAMGYYQEGLIYYLNGKYDNAIASLGQALANPGDNAADALYYQAMAYQKQGNQTQAVAKFDQVIRSYPSSSRLSDALFQKAESQSRAKNYDAAIATYRQLATSQPDNDLAQQARWEAAQLLEYLNRPDDARKEYATLQQTYPNGKYAEDALFRQGLSYFESGQYDQALQVWVGYLKSYPNGSQKARGVFWAGKAAQKAGKGTDASSYLQQAIQISPDEYYGFRAKEISQTITSTLPFDKARQNLIMPDSDKERNEMVDWLGKWVTSPPTIGVFSTISVTLQENPSFKKGQDLLKLGLKDDAVSEFNGVISQFPRDGVLQFQLSLFFRDKELYNLSIGAASRVAALSGEKNYLNLPRYLLKLIYPAYYGNLVLAEADKGNFDPLLMLSLMRQESLFEKDALSAADARGLTQVIPDTANWLAQKLGITSFSLSDLNKPYLSVRFGATYLGGLLTQFDGNPFFALAGYNGGPGNVARWSNNNPKDDVDLFTEDIDYSETQRYVKLVMEYYEMYQAIYGSASN